MTASNLKAAFWYSKFLGQQGNERPVGFSFFGYGVEPDTQEADAIIAQFNFFNAIET